MTSVPHVLTSQYIADRWPLLFHSAEAGSWPSIQRHGLLSTTALLDLFEVSGRDREEIEENRRPESMPIHHPGYGTAIIRDNKPINEAVLRRTLVGMSESEWYRTLNGRVFFWLTEARLGRLKNAAANRDKEHDLIVISTERLLAAYEQSVELSPINSGAVHPGAKNLRGEGTFRRIPEYPWAERRAMKASSRIVELTIPYAVPDILDFVVDVRPGV